MDYKIKEIANSICQISNHALEEIENLLRPKTIGKGTVFIREGQGIQLEYFLLEGICKSYLISPEGEEVTISFFTSKSILSPYTTRVNNQRSLLNFRALTDVHLASMDAAAFEQLMIENLEIRNFGNVVLRKELALKVDKEIGLAALTAKERLLAFRERYPSLENQIPHTDIASYLGITNVSLSRLRKDLSR